MLILFRSLSRRFRKTVIASCGVVAGVAIGLFVFSSLAYASNSDSINLALSSTQYLSISNASSTGLGLTGDFTIEAWVKLASQPTGNVAYTIAAKWDGDNAARSYTFAYAQDGGNHLLCSVSHGGNTNPQINESQTLSTGVWYHVAEVYTASSGNCEIFVNGTSIGSGTTDTGGPYAGTAAFSIGAVVGNSPANLLDGKIDDVRVYNAARTQSQIASDYSDELTGSEGNLVGYWPLDNSLTDLTSDGNTLTNNNSATFSTDVPFGAAASGTKVRKSSSESIANRTTLHTDSQLSVLLSSGTTYVIDGVMFASTTSGTPNLKIGFNAPTGSTVTIGYSAIGTSASSGGEITNSGVTSNSITLPADTVVPVYVHGTVVTGGSGGNLDFQWAQASSNAASVSIGTGSYLTATAF